MIQFFYLLLIFLLLPQCSSINLNTQAEQPKVIPMAQQAAVWQQNKANLTHLKTNQPWKLAARIGVITSEQSASSQLDWVNTPNSYDIKLNNALTFGEVKIFHNQTKTKLFYDNKEYTADNPEELLLKLTKIKLPISELQYWVLGLPSPNYNSSDFKLNDYATLSNLKQVGFNINYDNYSLLNNKYILPSKVILKSKNLYIKISVENWDL